jgi:putative acetyltransferase
MQIRSIRQEDNAILAQIIRAIFIEFDAPQQGTVYTDPTTDDLFSLFQQTPKSILWVAESEGEVVGCCGLLPIAGIGDEYVELVKFYLSAKARGKGIGKALMQKTIISAKDLGYKGIYLESLPHFATAVKMYEKDGFQRLKAPIGNSIHGTCDVWMSKEL